MASRGWEGVSLSDITRQQLKHEQKPKRSKYGNVKITVDGHRFDSKREADHWLMLRARQELGEIRELNRQIAYPLLCPSPDWLSHAEVCVYRADFVWIDTRTGDRHVEDAKGFRTPLYALKRKWMSLQYGIELEEV